MYRQHYPDDPGMHQLPGSSNSRFRGHGEPPSFVERVKNSLVGCVVGFALLCSATGLLFWNEGRAVQTAKSLEEGLRLVVPLHTTQVAFDENNGKLVHLTGQLQTSEVLYDEAYSVAMNAVKLRRKVEMFQWVETEHTREYNDGGRSETVYSYSAEWRNTLIRSTSFSNPTGHHNPSTFAIEAKTFTAKDVRVGNFFLSSDLIDLIGNFHQFYLDYLPATIDNSYTLHQGAAYHGKDPLNPEIGDIKVMFEYAGLSGKPDSKIGPPDMVSIMAKQDGNQLVVYQTEAGDDLELLYIGDYTPTQIIGREQTQNSLLTWSIRFGGWLLMFIGFGCINQIIVTLVDWIPIVRDVIQLGLAGMNGALAISLSLTVIALGWIFYRPWLGISVLFFASLPFVISRLRANSRRRRVPTGRSVYD